jgi:hypothetical protein
MQFDQLQRREFITLVGGAALLVEETKPGWDCLGDQVALSSTDRSRCGANRLVEALVSESR